MAKPNKELINGIKNTVAKLQAGNDYMWGHMGACNCGNLVQQLTGLSRGEIHAYAMEKYGDWSEQILDYCPVSGFPMDLLISQLLEKGLELEDLKHLEKLSDPEILSAIPSHKFLKYNSKEDVIEYLISWGNILEDKLKKIISKARELEPVLVNS